MTAKLEGNLAAPEQVFLPPSARPKPSSALAEIRSTAKSNGAIARSIAAARQGNGFPAIWQQLK
jgi:hypothetical protein